MIISSSKKLNPNEANVLIVKLINQGRLLLKELKRTLEALLEINDRDLFIQGSWNLQTGNTARQEPRSVLKKKEKLKFLE